MRKVALPQMVAGRDLADEVVDSLGALAGEVVFVDATGLVVGAPSFAAQLVERVLVAGGAARLTINGAPHDFVDYVRSAAERLDVANRVAVERIAEPVH